MKKNQYIAQCVFKYYADCAMVTNKTDIVRFHRFAHHRRI